jgi:hypothetical protein
MRCEKLLLVAGVQPAACDVGAFNELRGIVCLCVQQAGGPSHHQHGGEPGAIGAQQQSQGDEEYQDREHDEGKVKGNEVSQNGCRSEARPNQRDAAQDRHQDYRHVEALTHVAVPLGDAQETGDQGGIGRDEERVGGGWERRHGASDGLVRQVDQSARREQTESERPPLPRPRTRRPVHPDTGEDGDGRRHEEAGEERVLDQGGRKPRVGECGRGAAHEVGEPGPPETLRRHSPTVRL